MRLGICIFPSAAGLQLHTYATMLVCISQNKLSKGTRSPIVCFTFFLHDLFASPAHWRIEDSDFLKIRNVFVIIGINSMNDTIIFHLPVGLNMQSDIEN